MKLKKVKTYFCWLAICVATSLQCYPQSTALYFLLREIPGNEIRHDSFVVPILQSDLIEHARKFILDPNHQDRRIVVTRVKRGGDGVNRNYLRADKNLWSWHVTATISFSDSAPQNLQSQFPKALEEASDELWEYLETRTIYFPNYLVSQELGPNPLWMILDAQGENLIITWADHGQGTNYTLEMATSVDGGWNPLPGFSWPITQTSIEIPQPTGVQFFRVKAEKSVQP